MYKKILPAVIGLVFASVPLLVSAQTATDTCSTNPTVECLQSEIQQLIQILNQLIAAHHSSGNSSFTATPTSGQAPLSVTFTASVNPQGPISIDFGDGASSTIGFGGCSSACPLSTTHTYTANGTYTAKLSGNSGTCSNCLLPNIVQPLGTVTITVGATNTETLTASPSSGSTPLSVTFTATPVSTSDEWLDFGDGSTGEAMPGSGAGGAGQSVTPGTAFYTYHTPGKYTATLKTSSTGTTLGTATVTAGSAHSASLTASPSSGPAPLTVTFTDGNGNPGDFINFGDGVYGYVGCVIGDFGAESGCFASHTYTNIGTYTATLTTGQPPTGTELVATSTAPLWNGGTISGTVAITVQDGRGSCRVQLPSHDIQLGDSDSEVGGDVTVLQQFLASQGSGIYPEQLVTGFFGNATKAAVQRFQTAHNISPVSGFVGRLTRQAFIDLCGQGETHTGTYSFGGSPASGQAPLLVTFTAKNAETLGVHGSYVVDFGDGNRATMAKNGNGLLTSHTYTTGGTFVSKLFQETNLCNGITAYGCVADLQVDSATTTVTTPATPTPTPTPTPSYSPGNTTPCIGGLYSSSCQ